MLFMQIDALKNESLSNLQAKEREKKKVFHAEIEKKV